MTMVNRFNHPEGEAILRRCISNIVAALSLVARPARLHARPSWLRSPRDFVLATLGAIVIFLILMATIDATAIRAVGSLPHWIVSLFDDLTEYGKSGWFLWPLGLLFVALSALPPILTSVSQRVLAAIMVRVGFLFAAIAVPSLFSTIVKRMIGRARPMVGGSLDPSLFSPFAWRVEYAGMPSGHATTAFAVLVAFGTLWPARVQYCWFMRLQSQSVAWL